MATDARPEDSDRRCPPNEYTHTPEGSTTKPPEATTSFRSFLARTANVQGHGASRVKRSDSASPGCGSPFRLRDATCNAATVPRFGIGQHFRTSPFTFKPACLFQTGFGKNIGRVFGQCTLSGVPDNALPPMGCLEGGVSLRAEIHHAQHGSRLDEFGPEVLLRLKGTCPARVQGPWWGAQQREDAFEPNRGQSNNGGVGRKPNPTCPNHASEEKPVTFWGREVVLATSPRRITRRWRASPPQTRARLR